jgi:hypothetical protein
MLCYAILWFVILLLNKVMKSSFATGHSAVMKIFAFDSVLFQQL